jgi:hypothetical protein
MELTYSTQKTDFDPDKRYRNPQYFERVESGITKVVVIGDWPAVVDAYNAVDVEVETVKVPKPKKVAKTVTKAVLFTAEDADGKWIVTGAGGKQVGVPFETKDLADAEAKRLNETE